MSYHDVISESSNPHGPVGWRYDRSEMARIGELGWWHGGMPPDLSPPRHMLRAGHPIAAVAAETGFADQSHLTRLFRSAFGTTPGRYRRG